MKRILFILTYIILSLHSQAQNVSNQPPIVELDTGAIFYDDEPSQTPSSIIIGNDEEEYQDYDGAVYDETPPANDNQTDLIINPIDTSITPYMRKVIADSSYWIGIDPYFKIFDSMTVNPYHIVFKNYKDTTPITLYQEDSVTNRSWSMPLARKHELTSNFGPRWSRYHYGADLRLAIGDSVLACFDGVVRIAKYNRGGYGNYVLVRHHNGLETLYGHLSKRLVKVGQEVKAGDLIGFGGNTGRSTGPHLHFEVRYRGNAIDPKHIYDFPANKIKDSVYVISPATYKYIKQMYARRYHRIRRGDTLYGIARKYRVSAGQICRLNGISKRTILRVGRKLRVK